MSKADKMRGKLLSVQKDREEFEKQKKQLEEQVDFNSIFSEIGLKIFVLSDAYRQAKHRSDTKRAEKQ
jgi:acetone carboxylase gamma subunit